MLPPAPVTLIALASGVWALTDAHGQVQTDVSRTVLPSMTLSAAVDLRMRTPSFKW